VRLVLSAPWYATQQVAEADLLIESRFEAVFVFTAIRVLDEVTSKPEDGLAPSR
jgi:hypothetical protein